MKKERTIKRLLKNSEKNLFVLEDDRNNESLYEIYGI